MSIYVYTYIRIYLYMNTYDLICTHIIHIMTSYPQHLISPSTALFPFKAHLPHGLAGGAPPHESRRERRAVLRGAAATGRQAATRAGIMGLLWDDYGIIWLYPLGNIQKAIENGPIKIVDLPSYKMVMFHSVLYVY